MRRASREGRGGVPPAQAGSRPADGWFQPSGDCLGFLLSSSVCWPAKAWDNETGPDHAQIPGPESSRDLRAGAAGAPTPSTQPGARAWEPPSHCEPSPPGCPVHSWDPPRGPSVDEWIKNTRHMCTMGLCATINTDEMMAFASNWIKWRASC